MLNASHKQEATTQTHTECAKKDHIHNDSPCLTVPDHLHPSDGFTHFTESVVNKLLCHVRLQLQENIITTEQILTFYGCRKAWICKDLTRTLYSYPRKLFIDNNCQYILLYMGTDISKWHLLDNCIFVIQ